MNKLTSNTNQFPLDRNQIDINRIPSVTDTFPSGIGIPDEMFIRTEGVPMTKREIRILALANLQLFPGATVYDVGAGSGSVAIECKRLVSDGDVFAVEQHGQAVKTIDANCQKFGVALHVLEGQAPEALLALPMADRIFIGGSGGKLAEIINTCDQQLRPGGRIVLTSVTMTTGSDAYRIFRELSYEVEVIQVNVAQLTTVGNADLWKARNPVTLITAVKGE